MSPSSQASKPARPSFAARAGHARLPEFEVLDHAHQAALAMLESFQQLVARLKNPGLVADVKCLQQDHGWLEEDRDELRPHVLAIADGHNGYDLPLLTAAQPIFQALYREHIHLEESRVYPEAKRQKLALLEGRSGQPVEI